MENLIIGSSSGLGKEIFEQLGKQKEKLSCISRYSDEKIYEEHKAMGGQIIRCDLSRFNLQEEYDELVGTLPYLDKIYITLGGGFGRKKILPNYEDFELVYRMNLFAPCCILRSLRNLKKIGITSKICFISSIASVEVVASPVYSSAKAALNTFCKSATKQKKTQFGSMTNFICGAFEGNGSAFDRLKSRNEEAYNSFIEKRLPNGKPLGTEELAAYIIATMNLSRELIDGMAIKVDGNESFSI